MAKLYSPSLLSPFSSLLCSASHTHFCSPFSNGVVDTQVSIFPLVFVFFFCLCVSSLPFCLRILHDPYFGGAEDSTVQGEAFALGVEDVSVLSAVDFGHEGGFVQPGVEFAPFFDRVESLEAVLLQR